MHLKKIYIESLGCPKNLVDSEKILKAFSDNNYQITTLPEEANVIVVNTCGFIDEAVEESIDTILELAEYKKRDSSVKLVVSGCMSQRYKTDLQKELPEVDLITGSSDIEKIPGLVETNKRFHVGHPDYNSWNAGRILLSPPHYAYVKIAEGCSANCAFCIIPKLRGRQKSNSIENIVRESSELINIGVKELVLIAQDTIAYGRDIKNKKVTLLELLNEIVKINGLKWLRMLYLYPETFNEDFINIFKNTVLLPYIDMPVQHINDHILKLMNRRTGKKEIESALYNLRKIDNVVLRTSVIVGFPGEDDRKFDELVNFVKEQEFDYLGIFRYRNEEEAASFRFDKQVEEDVKTERWNYLNLIQEEIVDKKNRKYIGKITDVVIEGEEDGYYIGRAWFQAPEIDGVIKLKSNRLLKIGNFYKVEIIDSFGYNFEGKLSREE